LRPVDIARSRINGTVVSCNTHLNVNVLVGAG
jgi:hypothetical protein